MQQATGATLPLTVNRRQIAPFLTVLLAALWIGTGVAAQMGPPGGRGAPAGPTTVGVITVARETVALQEIVPGRALASEQSAVRPRVGGVITDMLYEPGAAVAVGTPLFQIEDEVFRANLAAAEAQLVQAQTARDNAAATVERVERLSNSTTRVEGDTARATLASAEAQLINAQNARDNAARDLRHTIVTSPIAGIAGLPEVTIGDLVTANQATGLVTITRIDPIHIDLSEPSARLMSLRNQIEAGLLSANDSVDVTLTLDDGSSYAGAGRLIAPGITVSTSTGTQTMRFSFENPEARILPGMFVRGAVTLGTLEAILLPQRATSRGNDGTLTVWAVGPENKTVRRRLETMGATNNNWIVTAGLEDGDQVLLDGLRNMQEGREVIPTPVRINALGLVEDLEPATPPAGAGQGNAQEQAPTGQRPAGDAPARPAPAGGN